MMRCKSCDEHVREVAMLADLSAFWAFQAKWYYAAAIGLGRYDELPLAAQKKIDAVFEKHRVAENRERVGHVAPSYDIGT
jgi:hypothetical protein